ncbi:protein dispatched homolog 2 [Carlito syrichta]|uniref:Protein dispatched homolog 2 n=1 Tax=Carlito syrichta TaxID=1868482 RepID=A0A3Q0EDH2_CARSF|nr:protein dispatched homolog 2 [Carlito syrichta]
MPWVCFSSYKALNKALRLLRDNHLLATVSFEGPQRLPPINPLGPEYIEDLALGTICDLVEEILRVTTMEAIPVGHHLSAAHSPVGHPLAMAQGPVGLPPAMAQGPVGLPPGMAQGPIGLPLAMAQDPVGHLLAMAQDPVGHPLAMVQDPSLRFHLEGSLHGPRSLVPYEKVEAPRKGQMAGLLKAAPRPGQGGGVYTASPRSWRNGPAPGPGPEGEQRPEGEPLAPDGSPPNSTQTEAVAPEASPERSCSLHSCPLEDPSSSSGPPPTSSTLQPVGPSSPLAPAHFTYPRPPQEYQGGSSLPGLGDRAALCSHGSSLSPSPAPSQRDGAWKPPAVQHHVVSVRQERAFRMPKSYSQLIAEWPVAMLLLCLAVILLCTLAGLLGSRLPDFSKPLLGFEPRDTDIGRKLVVWRALQALTGPRKLLSLSPDLELNSSSSHIILNPTPWGNAQEGIVRPRRMVELLEDRGQESFFCGPPEKSYAQLVFMSTSAGSLWNLHAIHSMCRMERDQIRSHAHFGALCQRTATNECCPSWSLGNYVAVLSNRSSCLDTTQADAARILALLRTCALYYHRGALVPSCLGPRQDKSPRCAQVPTKCSRSSAIYQLLHFLLDRDFLSPQTADYQVPSLKYSLLFLPTPKGASMMGIYLDRLATSWRLSDNYTSITGMDLGLKQELLKHYLAQDTAYPLLAVAAIFFSIALYLRSFFLTLMVLLGVLGSLLVAFFLYQVAFRMAYFPFVNLAALVLLSSVCANHTLIFFDLWRLSKSQLPAAGLAQRVGRTMHHFGYLLLVSGLTTTRGPWAGSAPRRLALALHRRFRGLRRAAAGTARLLFQRLLPCGVIKFRYIWICWFAALAAGGAYIAGVSPRLRLPTLPPPGGQVFRPSHPFERFDAEYRQQFLFEQLPQGEGGHMPVVLVWGVLPVDTGDPLDPRSNSSLIRDPSFSASSPEAQRWLLALCHRAQNQSFFDTQQEGWPTLCFVEALQRWMVSPGCARLGPDLCCGHSGFPWAPQLFQHCLKRMALEQGPRGTRDLGPRFDAHGSLAALVLQFQTNFQYSPDYNETHHFYTEVSHWLAVELGTAPPGLRHGWFTSRLELYSLQHSLSTEPAVVLGLALALAFATLLLGTWNVPLSLFSVAAVAGTVLLTVGLLVLLEWQLNTAEALFLSASVGLSVDFTVNYCISYHLCPHPDRLSRVAFSLRQTSCATAVGAAALFAAGVLMLPATVLLYRKLGIILMMVKCVSCGFASFFFQSLCCFFGPEKNCGQILWPCAHLPWDAGTGESGGEKAGRLRPGPVGGAAGSCSEQYELQPLARRRSPSFDTSTATSKLSHRPSVLSEDLQLHDGPCCSRPPLAPASPRELLLDHQAVFSQCPALQTSSPYKQVGPSPKTRATKDSQGQEAEPPQASPEAPADSPKPKAAEPPDGLCSSASTLEGLSVSDETCLSNSEPSARVPDSVGASPEDLGDAGQPVPERGQLNGRRDTLWLALRETVYDPSLPTSHQSSSSWKGRGGPGDGSPVVLPNSQPDLPDVWLRRPSTHTSGYSS